MTPAARIAAAVEVIASIDAMRVPAAQALKEWGLSHRFAGSGDRAAISGLVYDTLRRRASSTFLLGEDSARARVLGMLKLERGLDVETIARLCSGERHAPDQLNERERAALGSATLDGAPTHIAGDYPEWLDGSFARVFGNERVKEAIAMSHRAPLDLRVNTLRADRDKVLASLRHLRAQPTPWSPAGLRILLDADARSPGIQAEPDFIKGAIEVQDEGSQLAALLADAREGETVVDLCAGAGGKTLALAAMMGGRGRLVATDADKRQLAPIHERLKRAGAHNVEVRTPKGDDDGLSDLAGRCDLVVIDAPCTGTGTWRRNPDAKWRIRPGALEIRIRDQIEVLDRAVPLLRRGGRIAYITCSVLQEENSDQISAFIARHNEFARVPPREVAAKLGQSANGFCNSVRLFDEGLLMTPHRTGTDGFFVALLKRPQ
jgi:16S rRNA (cytosine967-C5)-methyltransferase